LAGEGQRSFIYSLAVIVSLLIIIVGLVLVILGFTSADPTQIKVEIPDSFALKVTTAQVGLIVLIVGAVLTGVLLILMPENVRTYGRRERGGFLKALVNIQPVALTLSIVVLVASSILLVLTLIS
jgi:hypothetical protein